MIKSLFLAIWLLLLVYLGISAQPILTVTVNDLDYDGVLFVAPHALHKCVVADLEGNTLYEYQVETACRDWRKLENGDWTLFNDDTQRWEQYPPYSDTIKATYSVSGGENDPHDIILRDDYVWLMGRADYVAISGTLVYTLRGSTLQKQDLSGNVLFDWHSKDHIGLDEATISIRPGGSYPHSNSFYEDSDGNLIVSFRQTNSVIKICTTGDNCQPGEIIWRLGGLKSDFVISNDGGFSKQHSAVMADLCHAGAARCLLLFDNGNDREPPYSRAVEYVLDTVNGLVTRTWEYSANGEIFAFALGNVARLPNGNTLIGWGAARGSDPDAPTVTVVDSEGNVKYKAFLPEGIASYRVHLYPVWRMYLPLIIR